MDLGLDSRVAVVAAASKGLGKAVAHGLAAEGARVLIFSRDAGSIVAAADEIRVATGADVVGVSADVLDPATAERVASEALERWGRIDVLFNNAGGPPPGLFDDFDDAAWQSAFELNLLSVVRMSRALLQSMR